MKCNDSLKWIDDIFNSSMVNKTIVWPVPCPFCYALNGPLLQ